MYTLGSGGKKNEHRILTKFLKHIGQMSNNTITATKLEMNKYFKDVIQE